MGITLVDNQFLKQCLRISAGDSIAQTENWAVYEILTLMHRQPLEL